MSFSALCFAPICRGESDVRGPLRRLWFHRCCLVRWHHRLHLGIGQRAALVRHKTARYVRIPQFGGDLPPFGQSSSPPPSRLTRLCERPGELSYRQQASSTRSPQNFDVPTPPFSPHRQTAHTSLVARSSFHRSSRPSRALGASIECLTPFYGLSSDHLCGI